MKAEIKSLATAGYDRIQVMAYVLYDMKQTFFLFYKRLEQTCERRHIFVQIWNLKSLFLSI